MKSVLIGVLSVVAFFGALLVLVGAGVVVAADSGVDALRKGAQ